MAPITYPCPLTTQLCRENQRASCAVWSTVPARSVRVASSSVRATADFGGGMELWFVAVGQSAAKVVGFHVFCRRGFRNKEFPSMWKVTFAIGSLLLLSVHAEARPYHRHHYCRPELFQSMASISGDDRIVSPPFGMPACLLWVRSLAISVWSDHSSIESRLELEAVSPSRPGTGHGGSSVRPRHDFATAGEWRHLVRARWQFWWSRHPGASSVYCRLHHR